jgi:hypothetical protein
MFHRRFILAALAAAISCPLAACGGGDEETTWDEFQPREARVEDLAEDSFLFTGFHYGAVFDASLAASTTVLSLGIARTSGAGHAMPQSVSANGGTAHGIATLEGSELTLTFDETSDRLPFTSDTVLVLRVEADVDDGRIRLTNAQTQVQQASAPR